MERARRENHSLKSIWKKFLCVVGWRGKILIGYQLLQLDNFRNKPQISLVAQWIRIHPPMQGTWVWSFVQEDATCQGATKPVCHNYWAQALAPMRGNYWACVPWLLKPMRLGPVLQNKRRRWSEKPQTAMKSSPCSLQLKSVQKAAKIQCCQKWVNNFFYKTKRYF